MAAVADEHHPVVVADLVAEVAEHGAVGLAQLVAHPLAVGVVGLGQVDGDEPVLVAGGHRVEPAGQQVEAEALRLLGEPDHRQPEVEELGDQAALGRLRLDEPAVALGVTVGRAGCGSARSCGTASRPRSTAPPSCSWPPPGWRTGPTSRASGSAAAGDGGGWGDHRERAGLEPERGAAGEAAVVLEVHACVAGRAVERAHEASLPLFPGSKHNRHDRSASCSRQPITRGRRIHGCRRLEPDHRTTHRTTVNPDAQPGRLALARVCRARLGRDARPRRAPTGLRRRHGLPRPAR